MRRLPWRRENLIAAAVILVAIAGVIGALTSFVIAEARARSRAEIDADFAAVAVADSVLPAVQAMTMLQRQSRGDLQYLVINPVTRAPIVGTIKAWPRATRSADGWLTIDASDPAGPMIAREGRLDGYFPVLIGRRTDRFDWARARSLGGFAALALLVCGVILFTASIELRRIRRRLAHFTERLRAFQQGETAARIDDPGDDVVAEAAGRIDATLGKLEHAIQRNRLIGATIAHDLQQPVAMAITRLDLTPDPTTAIAEVRSAFAEMQAKIDGILLLAQVDNRAPAMTLTDLADIVGGRIAFHRKAAGKSGLSIDQRLALAPILSERGLIETAFDNLMGNAIKYSVWGSRIDVETGEDDAMMVVRVTNQGAGMAGLPDAVGNYLARGSSSKDVQGLGIGLATAFAVAERHGGRIRFFERAGGEGLTVEMRLPRAGDASV